MDYARPFKAVFADPRWLKKMAITAGISLVPVLNLAVLGYLLEYQRSVATGRDDVLPAWDDLGGYWVLGLKGMTAGLVLTVPIWLVGLFFIVVAAAGSGGDTDQALTLVFCGMMVFYLLLLVYGLLLGLTYMGLLTRFNLDRRFSSFFKFGDVWRSVRANAGAYFGSLGMTWVLSFAMGLITSPISYGVSFAMVPAMNSAETLDDVGLALAGILAVQAVVGAILVVAYVPMYHLMFHYFGQYMGLAYGLRPNEPLVPPVRTMPEAGPDGAAADEPGAVLPPPPPPGG